MAQHSGAPARSGGSVVPRARLTSSPHQDLGPRAPFIRHILAAPGCRGGAGTGNGIWPASDVRPHSRVVDPGPIPSVHCEPADAEVLEVDVATDHQPHDKPCQSSKWRRMNPSQARGAPGHGV
eukprot:4695317-Pyramimonas_sp.AAC.1